MSADLEAQAQDQRRLARLIIENKSGAALQDAVRHLRRAAELWGQGNWPGPRAEVLTELGELQIRREHFGEAAEAYAEAAALLDSAGTEGARACEAHTGAARALRLNGELAAAGEHLDQAAATGRKTTDLMRVLRMAGVRLEQAELALARGQADEAIEAGSAALKTFTDYRKGGQEAACHELLARARLAAGDYESAGAEMERAVERNLELGRRFEASEVLSRFADAHRERGDLDRALELLERCLTIHRDDHNRQLIAVTQRLIGRVLTQRGDSVGARRHFEQSLELSRAVDDREGIARTLYLQAALERKQGDVITAMETLAASLQAAEDAGQLRVVERVLAATAKLQRQIEDHEGALATLHRWVDTLKQLGDRQEQLRVLGTMAVVHEEAGADAEAEAHLHRLIDACSQEEDVHQRVTAHRNLAVLLSKRRDYGEAAHHFQAALDDASDSELPASERASLHYQLAACQLKEDEFEAAALNYERAVKLGADQEQLQARALVGLGNARAALGDRGAAQELFDRAAALCEAQGDMRNTAIIRKATRERVE